MLLFMKCAPSHLERSLYTSHLIQSNGKTCYTHESNLKKENKKSKRQHFCEKLLLEAIGLFVPSLVRRDFNMSFDGVMTRAVVHELQERLIDGRIAKIYQL